MPTYGINKYPDVQVLHKGDTLTPLRRVLQYKSEALPVDLTAAGVSVAFKMFESNGTTEKVAETTSNVLIIPSANFTVDASTDIVTSSGHNLQNHDRVQLSTTDTLPAGLSALETYYVINRTADTFKLSKSPSDDAVDITDTGTGTHTFKPLGAVQYQWQTGDVDTAGTFYWYFIVISGSARDHFPVDQQKGVLEIHDN